jgi:hypothetical protein
LQGGIRKGARGEAWALGLGRTIATVFRVLSIHVRHLRNHTRGREHKKWFDLELLGLGYMQCGD